uniref:VWFA domain-containing protein n=1 Tax=Paramoeba aestuarina TaxID=180227 RepID=A0A7S4NZ37_9EUKA|mmetsp:Transcript_33248/g.51971  ORF Transcript_33248/g.51971 Transcript_33248/m.51971 type:complete len:309 (+) Transcript_33248:145-1071(+)
MQVLYVALVMVLLIISFLYLLASGKLEKKKRKESTKKEETGKERKNKWSTFRRFEDVYSSIEEVQVALRDAGLLSSSLIVAIDYTKSNDYTGDVTFGGLPLHSINPQSLGKDENPTTMNPYQQVISIIGRTLEEFDDDKRIPAFGFGDTTTTNRSAFPFFKDRVCYTVSEVLQRYDEITPFVKLSGPTNFAPVIYEAIDIVESCENAHLHILVIIADGQVTDEVDTIDAIVEASRHPLIIITVGVGDGPWDMMREFDDDLPERTFDNFQFVDYNAVMKAGKYGDASFALHALQELPQQYKALKELKML